MNKEELKNKITDLEKQLAEVKEQVNYIEFEGVKKGVREMPKKGEVYYFVDSAGYISHTCWAGGEDDLFRFNTGNCFKTEQEAEEYKENLLTKQALKDLVLELNNGVEIDWNDCNRKYFIYLRDSEEVLGQHYNISNNCRVVEYCLNENFLTIAKERIGEEKLIKLINSGI